MSLHLQSNSIYTNQLNTDNFARMLKDPSQCYKFYWLEAILTLMETTDEDLSFDSIINEMICAAWYSVVNYHLHLGPTIRGSQRIFWSMPSAFWKQIRFCRGLAASRICWMPSGETAGSCESIRTGWPSMFLTGCCLRF